ncbi:HTH domain-containing protein [Candidatus Parcubacteria bacterium]|nr:MAG: HTH domain-containing protein [Candidatus Parcubacteria bacterium]
MPRAITNKHRLRRRERMYEALKLKKEGLTIVEISKKFGVSVPMIYRDIREAMQESWERHKDVAQYLLTLEAERLELLWQKTFQRAKDTNFSDMEVVKTLLSIHKRKCDLFGIDAPKKIAPTTPDGREWRPFADLDDVTVEEMYKLAISLRQTGEIEKKQATKTFAKVAVKELKAASDNDKR